MRQYFPKPYEPFGGDISVKVDLSNETKIDINNISHIDTSSFALKANLGSLKTEVGKLDIEKLMSVRVDLNKLRDVVKNDVVKKTVYDKTELEKKTPDTSGLVKKTDYIAKITEIEGKIPSISGLATKTALTVVENKIPSVSSL